MRIISRQSWIADCIDLMFIDKVGDRISVAEPVVLTFNLVEGSEHGAYRLPETPTLSIPRDNAKEFFESMAKVADERGFPSPSEEHVRGVLKATEFHLDDMRKLALKLKK